MACRYHSRNSRHVKAAGQREQSKIGSDHHREKACHQSGEGGGVEWVSPVQWDRHQHRWGLLKHLPATGPSSSWDRYSALCDVTLLDLPGLASIFHSTDEDDRLPGADDARSNSVTVDGSLPAELLKTGIWLPTSRRARRVTRPFPDGHRPRQNVAWPKPAVTIRGWPPIATEVPSRTANR